MRSKAKWKRAGTPQPLGRNCDSIHFATILSSVLASSLLLLPFRSHSLTTNSSGVVQYTAIDNTVYTLQPWFGRNVAFLTPTNQVLDTNVMGPILIALDAAWDYYRLVSPVGRSPGVLSATTLLGRDTIAVVNSTCGAGCSYIGFTGTEMLPNYFSVLYNEYLFRRDYDQVLFYEFGRNWWFYGNQIAYRSPDVDPVVTGFAVYMRFASMDAAGLVGAPYNGNSFLQFRTAVTNLMDSYIANPSLNWSNTFRISQAPPNSLGLGGTDLFASLLMRLGRDFGDQTFNQNIWKQVAIRNTTSTTQRAVDNLILAASATVKTNLTRIFATTWKFPVSSNAVTEAQQKWGNPFLIRPTILASTAANTNLVLSWHTEWNNLYQLQASPDTLTWTNVGIPISGNGSVQSVTLSATDFPQQFFRISLP